MFVDGFESWYDVKLYSRLRVRVVRFNWGENVGLASGAGFKMWKRLK